MLGLDGAALLTALALTHIFYNFHARTPKPSFRATSVAAESVCHPAALLKSQFASKVQFKGRKKEKNEAGSDALAPHHFVSGSALPAQLCYVLAATYHIYKPFTPHLPRPAATPRHITQQHHPNQHPLKEEQ